MKKWFPSLVIKQKRKEIQNLLISLTKELNAAAADVLKLLGADEEEMDVSDVDNRDKNLPSDERDAHINEEISQKDVSGVNDKTKDPAD